MSFNPIEPSLQIGSIALDTSGDDSFWIENEDGEGTELPVPVLENFLKKFLRENA